MVDQLSILLVSPAADERAQLAELVRHGDSSGKLWKKYALSETESAKRAKQLLTGPEIDLCLVGSALGEDEQEFLVRSVTRRLSPGATLMIPVLERGDQHTLLRFIQAGARGILLAPVSPEAFVEVMKNALDIRPRAHLPPKEDVASLPWVLEHVAQRLTELAERVRDEEAGTPIRANPKLIQEALLGVIGTSSAEQEQNLMRLAELLAKEEKS